jgi:hypothetical protein
VDRAAGAVARGHLPAARASSAHAEDVAFAVASWALCGRVRRRPAPPPRDPLLLVAMPALPRAVIDACRGLAVHLRERTPVFYQRTADETEAHAADEVEAARAEDLGKIDTFEFEERQGVPAAALAAWEGRAGRSRSRGRRSGSTARRSGSRTAPPASPPGSSRATRRCLGQAIAAPGPRWRRGRARGGRRRYVARGAAVDQAHRQLEQRVGRLYPQLPEFETLRARLDALRELAHLGRRLGARLQRACARRTGFVPARRCSSARCSTRSCAR